MKTFLMTLLCVLFLSVSGCGGGDSSSDDEGSGQTVTITGNLSTLVWAQISAERVRTRIPAADYNLLVFDETQDSYVLAPIDADGEFSFEAEASDELVVRVLDTDYGNAGALITTATADVVTVGVAVPSTGSTQDLGSITFDPAAGTATGDSLATYAADSHQCSASEDGTPIGGILGFITEGVFDTYLTALDADGDCVPDAVDGDDDNDATIDDLDGEDAVGVCGDYEVVMFMNNKVDVGAVSAAETGDEIFVAQHIYYRGDEDITLSDLTVSVAGPSYLGSSAVHEAATYYDTEVTGGSVWDQTLVSCGDGNNMCMFIEPGEGISYDYAGVMAAGDTYVYTITEADGDTTTCVRMLNTVFTYTPYNVRVGDDGDAVADLTSIDDVIQVLEIESLDTNDDGILKFAFDIPAGMQLGFTPQIEPGPYDASCAMEGFTNIEMTDIDATFTGDTRTSADEGLDDVELIVDLNGVLWPEADGNAWYIDIAFRSSNGDNAAASGIRLRHEGSECAD